MKEVKKGPMKILNVLMRHASIGYFSWTRWSNSTFWFCIGEYFHFSFNFHFINKSEYFYPVPLCNHYLDIHTGADQQKFNYASYSSLNKTNLIFRYVEGARVGQFWNSPRHWRWADFWPAQAPPTQWKIKVVFGWSMQ